jgi:hypothetical protein
MGACAELMGAVKNKVRIHEPAAMMRHILFFYHVLRCAT